MKTQDKKLPFQLIHFFICFAKLRHLSESERKSSNIMFSDDELVIISHLEQAATDLRCANPELIEQAKRILAESPYVPGADFKRFLLASIELLLIDAKVRQKNPALYDSLYQNTLWYFHNRDILPNEVVKEIDHYLTSFYPEKYSHQPHNGTQQAHPHTIPGLITRTASVRLNSAKSKPPFTPLFDVFWGKGELAFLFGETGIGKSILAVQIADAISKGAKVQGFDGPQEPMKVALFDFKLSTRQFLKRYSDKSGKVYEFSPNFLRAEIDANAEIPKGIDYILERIENTIIHDRIEVALIDNLTALVSNINKKEEATGIMSKLLLMKMRNNISMLVVGHSLRQDSSQPITEYDMVGSIFCDSAFAIGESAKEKNVRYLKQIKTSSAQLRYDVGYVAVFRLVKRNSFLGFEHIGFDCEYEHLCDFP